MIGIGLGGFVQGVERGQRIGERARDTYDKRQQKSALDAIDTQGRAEFEAQGGGDWDTFQNQVLTPRRAAEYLKQDNPRMAKAWMEWSKSEGARRGSRLFADALIAGQAGDMETAISKFIEAGRVQGYGGGYKVNAAEPTESGGWRVRATGPDGKEFVHEFNTPAEVMQFGATYYNPEAAFEREMEQQAFESESARKVREAGDTERAKRGARTEDDITRQNLGLDTATQRDWIAARKQALAELEASGELMDADPADHDSLISERTKQLMGGGGAAPARGRSVIDTQTGERVSAPAAPQPAQPGAAVAMPRPEQTGLRVPTPRPRPQAPAAPAPRALGLGPRLQERITSSPEARAASKEQLRKTVLDPLIHGSPERQALDVNQEYEALRRQLQQVNPTSQDALTIGQRMREIELMVRGQQ